MLDRKSIGDLQDRVNPFVLKEAMVNQKIMYIDL